MALIICMGIMLLGAAIVSILLIKSILDIQREYLAIRTKCMTVTNWQQYFEAMRLVTRFSDKLWSSQLRSGLKELKNILEVKYQYLSIKEHA